jgi:hypothetical protein
MGRDQSLQMNGGIVLWYINQRAVGTQPVAGVECLCWMESFQMDLASHRVKSNGEVFEEVHHAKECIARQVGAKRCLGGNWTAGEINLDFVEVIPSRSPIGIERFVYLAFFYVESDSLSDLSVKRGDGRSRVNHRLETLGTGGIFLRQRNLHIQHCVVNSTTPRAGDGFVGNFQRCLY